MPWRVGKSKQALQAAMFVRGFGGRNDRVSSNVHAIFRKRSQNEGVQGFLNHRKVIKEAGQAQEASL
jgi:hypothetical protein